MNEPNANPTPAPTESDWGSRNHVRTLVLMGVTGFGIYLCYRLAAPILPALAWAMALAVLFTPLQRWLESKISSPSLAAVFAVLVIGLIVVVPTIFVGQQLTQQAAKGAEAIEAKIKSGEWKRAFEARPRLAEFASRVEEQIDLPETIKTLTTWLSTATGAILKGSVVQMVGLCLTFYLLFFFLRDRRMALQSLRYLSPLSETDMDRMLRRIDDTIFATIYGTLAVSAVQGLLGGLMFWWLGLPAPLLWGAVMALLGIVPVLGAFVVWLPAVLYLVMEGSWEKALILTLWGLLVVGTIDNLLRPLLVGKRLELHTVLAFVSVIGGLLLFGAAGLILGPVILTITMVLLEIWPTHNTVRTVARADPEALARLENEGGPAAPEPEAAGPQTHTAARA